MPILPFKLPSTKLCTVVWSRNGKTQEELIPTPRNTQDLGMVMLAKKVGASEIRAVKPVDTSEIIKKMQK